MLAEFSAYARALCEDFRHFLSEASITGHGLCEDFPNYFSAVHRLPWARRKVFICECLTGKYGSKTTCSCGILRLKFKKCEWVEVVCSNKARLVGDHIRINANNSGIKFKKGSGVYQCPKRRMAGGRGRGTWFVNWFVAFSSETERTFYSSVKLGFWGI